MSVTDVLRWLHFLSLFYMTAGLGAVMVPLWRGWRETSQLDRQVTAFEDATTAHRALLLPGTIAVGATGLAVAGNEGYNFITTGWLLSLEVIYLVVLFFCIPVLGHALNRVEVEALKSQKRKRATDELQTYLNDYVPIVFSLVILVFIPVMAYFAEFKPF